MSRQLASPGGSGIRTWTSVTALVRQAHSHWQNLSPARKLRKAKVLGTLAFLKADDVGVFGGLGIMGLERGGKGGGGGG